MRQDLSSCEVLEACVHYGTWQLCELSTHKKCSHWKQLVKYDQLYVTKMKFHHKGLEAFPHKKKEKLKANSLI